MIKKVNLPDSNALEYEYQIAFQQLVSNVIKNEKIRVIYKQPVGLSGYAPDGIIIDSLIGFVEWPFVLVPIEIKPVGKYNIGMGQVLSYGSRILRNDPNRKKQLVIFTDLKTITFSLIQIDPFQIFSTTQNLLPSKNLDPSKPTTGFELLFRVLTMTPEGLGKKLPSFPLLKDLVVTKFLNQGASSFVWKAQYNDKDVVVKKPNDFSYFNNEFEVMLIK